MRLIDANKLSNKSCPMGSRKYCCNCGEKRTIKNPYTNQSISCDDIRFDFLQMIDREKTAKAIPVEWIKKWKEKAADGSLCRSPLDLYDHYEYEAAIDRLLSDWEEENEEKRSEV